MLGTKVLGTKDAIATIAVKDLEVARRFYGDQLGLTPTESRDRSVQGYRSGNAALLVYESQFAGTNRATSATWVVGADFDGTVVALKSKGVKFEHYDLPGLKLQGDAHVAERMKVAWFKDPDGNILSIVSG